MNIFPCSALFSPMLVYFIKRTIMDLKRGNINKSMRGSQMKVEISKYLIFKYLNSKEETLTKVCVGAS